MTTTIPYRAGPDQVAILIEVEAVNNGESAIGHGAERVGPAEKVAQAATRTLSTALKSACVAAEEALTAVRGMASAAQEIEITFGVKLSATGDAIVAKGEAEANFAFKLVWKQPSS